MVERILVAFAMLVLVAIIAANGPVQFGGMDGGILSNAAWQCYIGHKPYQDFVTPLPAGFLIGAKLAFVIFGVHYTSFAYMAAVYAALAFLLHWALLRQLPIAMHWRLIIPFVIQALTNVEYSLWEYSPISASSASIFLTAVFVLLAGKPRRSTWILFAISTYLLMLMKVNVAGVSLLFGFAILATRPDLRLKAAGACLISGLACLQTLFLFDIDLFAMLKCYLSAGGRALQMSNIIGFLYSFHPDLANRACVSIAPSIAAFLLMLYFILCDKAWWKQHWRILALAFASVMAAFACVITNNDDPAEYLSMIFAVWLPLWGNYFAPTPGSFASGVTLAALLSIGMAIGHGIEMGVDRGIPLESGLFMFYDGDAEVKLRAVPDSAYFRGVASGNALMTTLHDMKAVLDLYHCDGVPDAPVFFGTRIDFGFPAYGIHNRKGLPLWWNALGEMPKAVEDKCVDQFIANNYKLCLFLGYPFYPDRLLTYLNTHYNTFHAGYLTVQVAKDWPVPKPVENAGTPPQ